MFIRIFTLVLLISALFFHQAAFAQFQLDLETGATFYGYNEFRVPGDEGTLVQVGDNFTTNTRFFYRVKLLYTLNEKHTFAALFAPLTILSQGNTSDNINFAGTVFNPSDDLKINYQFNSYRLTYRYLFPRKGDVQFGLGATAKIRDAQIRLENDSRQATKENVGFVPLINFRLEWFAMERASLLLQGDALIAPQGRAEDVLLAALFYPSSNVVLKAGYRILEGGADNDEVYNFSLVNYALIGGVFRF
jgi:hypothetical protein